MDRRRRGREAEPWGHGSVWSESRDFGIAGTRVAHSFRAGADGLALLSYGTRDSADIAYDPRSGKVDIRGIDLIMRPERSDYGDRED